MTKKAMLIIESLLFFFIVLPGNQVNIGELQGILAPTATLPFACSAHDPIEFLRFSSDGRYLLAKWDNTIPVWNVETGDRIVTLEPSSGSQITTAAFSPGSQYIGTGDSKGAASIWDLTNGKNVLTLNGSEATGSSISNLAVSDIHFLPSEELVITSNHERIYIWNLRTGSLVRFITDYSETGLHSFSSDGNYVITDTSRVYVLATGQIFHYFESQGTGTFSQNGKYIFTQFPLALNVWDGHTSQPLTSLKQQFFLNSSPDEQHLLTFEETDRALNIILWQITPTAKLHEFLSGIPPIARFFPTGKYILLAHALELPLTNTPSVSEPLQQNFLVWNIEKQHMERSIIIAGQPNDRLSISPTGSFIVTGTDDGQLRLWDIMTGKLLRYFC